LKIALIYITAAILSFCATSYAQESQNPAPAIVEAVTVESPAALPSVPTVAVPEPAAPPQWAIDIMTTAQELPVIGPIVSKALLYLGILSAIVTSLVACLLAILRALSGIASLAGLVSFAAKVQAFKDSKIMYYLTLVSLFNAKKADPKLVDKSVDSGDNSPKAA
jgi:hypothetical protein